MKLPELRRLLRRQRPPKLERVHRLSWRFIDERERNACVVTGGDVGKYAFQQDDRSIWLLVSAHEFKSKWNLVSRDGVLAEDEVWNGKTCPCCRERVPVEGHLFCVDCAEEKKRRASESIVHDDSEAVTADVGVGTPWQCISCKKKPAKSGRLFCTDCDVRP